MQINNGTFSESGSDHPRAVLAYFFATLNAVADAENATFFPIVIDAPNQQEQDPENLSKILEFIPKRTPEGRQVIVGLVDDAGVQFSGSRITLTEKFAVLREEEYESGSVEIAHFEQANIGASE